VAGWDCGGLALAEQVDQAIALPVQVLIACEIWAKIRGVIVVIEQKASLCFDRYQPVAEVDQFRVGAGRGSNRQRGHGHTGGERQEE
jgi:hypothetical protein